MKVLRAEIIPYGLQLNIALPGTAESGSAQPRPPGSTKNGGQTRRGWLLQLTTEDGAIDYGEVAPLAGFSREAPDEACAQLEAVAVLLPEINPWPDAPADMLMRVAKELPRACAASVRFGVETALLNVLAGRRKTPWHQELGRPWRARVAVNALVSGDEAMLAEGARRAVAEGFGCLKVKVGGLAAEAASVAVRAVRAAAGDALGLRVDVNRAWTLAEALAFAAGVQGCGIEYVEEPVADVEDLAAFRAQSGLRVAVDESLNAAVVPGADFWILKPTLRGGIAATLALADGARHAGAVPVISSAFESGVGMRALFQLAAITHDATTAAGLGTGAWFAGDVLAEPLRISEGGCDVEGGIVFPTRLAKGILA